VQIYGHFPLMARLMDKLSFIRALGKIRDSQVFVGTC
jgi:hypothetical protein